MYIYIQKGTHILEYSTNVFYKAQCLIWPILPSFFKGQLLNYSSHNIHSNNILLIFQIRHKLSLFFWVPNLDQTVREKLSKSYIV